MKSRKFGYYYEKFKAYLLVFLMILCVVQVGILWSSQSGSFPSFLSPFFSDTKARSQASIEDIKGDYLLPYRVIISTGFDGDHYMIPNGSPEYDTLWNGAKLYLTQALDTKPKQVKLFSEDEWGTLVANKQFTFEFKTLIPIDIIKWVLDLNSTSTNSEGASGIYKVIISPNDPDNSYIDTLYIRDDKNIYTYEVPDYNGNALNAEESNSIYAKQRSGANSKNYQLAIETFRVENFKKAPINISQDLIGPFVQKSTEIYPSITCQPFANLDAQVQDKDDYNKIAEELFGEAKNNYDPDEDVNGSAVFKKKDSVYRLYKNSILEYRFTENQGITEKPKVLDAYKRAIGFIMGHSSQNDFMSGISIYLKSIEESQNSYVFKFDYSISLGGENGEVPIYFKNYQIPNSDTQISASITIEASSKRVIHCEWIALKFKVDKNLDSYKWNLADLQPKAYNAYPELAKKELSVKDFGIYYVLSYPKSIDKIITPSFVLFTKDGSYDILMERNYK